MKFGLIGGNGFVGSGIRRTIEREGHSIVLITRDSYEGLRGSRFDALINANGNSKKYLAAKSPSEEFQASVVSVQRSLLDFTYDHYVHCSSVDVYPDHEHPRANSETAAIDPSKLSLYGFHKYLAEEIVKRYAASWVILRFGGFVGEGLKKNSIYDMLHDVPLRVHADSHYQYLPTEFAGTVILRLLENSTPSTIYNVCGNGCIALHEVMEMIGKRNVPYAVESPPVEHYEISIEKIKNVLPIPSSLESVREYIIAERQLARNI